MVHTHFSNLGVTLNAPDSYKQDQTTTKNLGSLSHVSNEITKSLALKTIHDSVRESHFSLYYDTQLFSRLSDSFREFPATAPPINFDDDSSTYSDELREST